MIRLIRQDKFPICALYAERTAVDARTQSTITFRDYYACVLHAKRAAVHTHAGRYYVSGRTPPRNATNHYFVPFMSMKMRFI